MLIDILQSVFSREVFSNTEVGARFTVSQYVSVQHPRTQASEDTDKTFKAQY